MTTLAVRVGAIVDDAIEAALGCFNFVATLSMGSSFGGVDNFSAMRFAGMAIPAGATIDSATVTFRASFTVLGLPELEIVLEDEDDPGDFTLPCDVIGRTRTAARVDWDVTSWVFAGDEVSASFPAPVQEVLDRPGFAGDHMVVIIHSDDIPANRAIIAAAYLSGASIAPLLTVDYTPLPGEPTFTATNPVSPSESNTPFIIGSAEAGSTVQLYADAGCTIPIGLPTPAADFASPGIPVTVPDWSTTTFHAIATNVAGPSPCSSDSITYVNLVPSVVIGLLAICIDLGIDPWTLISPSGFLQILEAFIGSGFVPDPDAEEISLEDMVREKTPAAASGFRKDSGDHLWDI